MLRTTMLKTIVPMAILVSWTSVATAQEPECIRITGDQGFTQYRDLRGTPDRCWDATGATWYTQKFPERQNPYPVRLYSRNGHWKGGLIEGVNPPADNRAEASRGGNSKALLVQGDSRGMLVEDVRIHNVWDGIQNSSKVVKSDWDNRDDWWDDDGNFKHGVTVRRVWISLSYDDCMSLTKGGVLVEDSLLDGCWISISTYEKNNNDRPVVVIRDTMMRNRAQIYKGRRGYATFFKDGGSYGPNIEIYDSVFYLGTPGEPFTYRTPSRTLFPPQERLTKCGGNTLVWVGEGDFPPYPEECFSVVTRDSSVWDRAVAQWKSDNPQLMRASVDTLSVSAGRQAR